MQGALVNAAVAGKPPRLLIVGGKMLDAGANALALHAVNEARGQLPGQIRILGVILKVAATQGAALDVDGGPQQNLHAAGACLPPKRRAHAAGQRRVKGRRGRAACGEADGFDAVIRVGAALLLGAQAVGAVADLDGRDAQPFHRLSVPEIRAGAQPGLFLQRQGCYKLLHSHTLESPLLRQYRTIPA